MLYLLPLLSVILVLIISSYALRASRTRNGWREITCFGLAMASLLWLPVYAYLGYGTAHFFTTGIGEHFHGMPMLRVATAVQLLLTVAAGSFLCFGWLKAKTQPGALSASGE